MNNVDYEQANEQESQERAGRDSNSQASDLGSHAMNQQMMHQLQMSAQHHWETTAPRPPAGMNRPR